MPLTFGGGFTRSMQVNKIYNESNLETMARMPDEFVNCVVTSPPYYGLRSYSAPDSVWGGDKDCAHDWQKHVKPAANGLVNNVMQGETLDGNSGTRSPSVSAFCTCGAWRGQLGLEPTFQMYLDHLIEIFAEVKRVLKKDGTCWVNLGDTFGTQSGNMRNPVSGKEFKTSGNALAVKQPNLNMHKSLLNIPARFAIRMTDEIQFIERNEIIWHKPACMPSSAKDRFTVDFEKIFFFTKSEKYYFEQQFDSFADKRMGNPGGGYQSYGGTDRNDTGRHLVWNADGAVQGRNARTTWSINYEPSSENHFASYPTKLIETPIKAGCKEGGIVYDPFAGTGTTLEVAHKLGRQFIGSEISEEYCEIANKRLKPILDQARLF